MIVYTAVHLASWTLIRYRLPVDTILIIFAALGINDIFNKIPVRRQSGEFHALEIAGND